MNSYRDEGADASRVAVRIPPSALLDLHRLATLREVARCGSYSAAAESLCFTPSAVSQQMTALARDLRTRLFDRTPKGMRLTAAAELLVTHVDSVFDRLNTAQAELEAVSAGLRGRLRIGSFPTATIDFVASAMAIVQDRFSRVDVSLADGEPFESVRRLKERELDLAAVFDFDHWALSTDFDGRVSCHDSDVECVQLFDDPFRVVLACENPLARLERIEVADLATERIVSGPSGYSPWGTVLREFSRRSGVDLDLDASYRTFDFAALQAIVATGRGVTLVPELALRRDFPGIVTRPLIGGPVRHVHVATLAGVALSPAARAMIELLRAATESRRTQPLSSVAVAG